MSRFTVQVIINGIAIWFTSWVLDSVDIVVGAGVPETDIPILNTAAVVAVISVIFTLVNASVKPIVKTLAVGFYILTLGLFFLVVNALMLMLTSWISGFTHYGIVVDGFWTAVIAAFIISIISLSLSPFLPKEKKS